MALLTTKSAVWRGGAQEDQTRSGPWDQGRLWMQTNNTYLLSLLYCVNSVYLTCKCDKQMWWTVVFKTVNMSVES